jgi:hypothetical protein
MVDGVAHDRRGDAAGFRFPEFAQLDSLAPARHDQKRSERSIGVIARLNPGVDLSTAAAEMRTIAGAVSAEDKDTNARWSVRVRSLHQSMTAETVAPSAVLLGAVTFVLFIACANVSNLLLVRAAEREREISIRLAIGSSRSASCSSSSPKASRSALPGACSA